MTEGSIPPIVLKPSTPIKLQFVREKLGISQVDLASLVGVSQGEISLIERGKSVPREDVRIKLAEVLGVKFETLMEVVEVEI